MIKKQIRVATAAFSAIVALTVLCGILWKISEAYSKGTGQIKVQEGTLEEIDGVKINVGTVERVWLDEDKWYDGENLDRDAVYFYKTETIECSKGQTKTGLRYEKESSSDLRNRWYFIKLSADFPQKETEGMHYVRGSELLYTASGYLSDGFSWVGEDRYRIPDYVTFGAEDSFLFYYDGHGPEQYKGFALPLNTVAYSGRTLCELDGRLYGYLGMAPAYEYQCTYSYTEADTKGTTENGAYASGSVTRGTWNFEETCENVTKPDFAEALSSFGMPEIQMKVNKGIYRFDEDGTATYVLPMGELAEGFSFLWLISSEEERTLTVVGTKGDTLLAYVYTPESGAIEERVLWEGGEAATAWQGLAEVYIVADLVTEGERTYLCYADIDMSQVRLSVFEAGARVFEGEVWQKEYGFGGPKEFSVNVNQANRREWVGDKLEITLSR